MKFVNPMTDTAEGKLLAIVKDIEKSLGIAKNSTYNTECNMGCEEGSACEQCYPSAKKVKKGFFDRKDTTDRERQDEEMRRRWRPDDADDFKFGLSEYDPRCMGG